MHIDKQAMLEFLATLPVFRKASPGLIESIYHESQIREFQEHEEIIREGTAHVEEGFIILDWSVDVFIGANYVTSLRKGDVFGEYAPIFRQNRTASVIVRMPLKCLVLSKRSLLRLVGHGSGLNRIIFRRIEENCRFRRWIFATKRK